MIKICNIFFGISCNNKTMLYRFVLAWTVLLCYTQSAFAVDSEFLKYCVGEKFLEKYTEAECWSCDIIKIMMNAMMTITERIYQRTQELCLLILQLGGVIWLALYFMKSLGSFAAQDPAKIIDGALTFMFKWAFIYAIILGGMDIIMEYIVNPILSIGFDVGTQFARSSGILGI